eukprot:gene41893-66061_t
MRLLATAPFTSALFFHFCTVFCRVDLGRWGVAAAYALGGGASVVSILLVPAHLVHHRDIGWIAVADEVGVVASMAWVILGIGGVWVLLHALLRARRLGDGQKFRQVAAVTASCLWGLLCLAGYGIAWRSTWEVESEIRSGQLVAVLEDFAAPPNGIFV